MAYGDTWERTIRHDGLNKFRVIKGKSKYEVNQKADAQLATWDEMWERKLEAEERREQREAMREYREKIIELKETKQEMASESTRKLQKELHELENVLEDGIDKKYLINWNKLKNKSKFSKKRPQKPKPEAIPEVPSKKRVDVPTYNIFDNIFKSLRERKITDYELNVRLANDKYMLDIEEWNNEKKSIEESNERNLKSYKENILNWEKEEKSFYTKQEKENSKNERLKEKYYNKIPDAIIQYCKLVLTHSKFPKYLPTQWDIDYNPVNKILIVDYSLPDIEVINTVKEVKYIQTKNELKGIYISDAALRKLYDNLLYQIVLRIIHELFEADVIKAIDSIVFNGWVNSIDKGTGKEVNACIMTIQTNKEEFTKINLEFVDPKTCFKNLKGIGSSKLYSLTPIAPILSINKEDKRFISSYDMSNQLDESYNLAAMDWEDFEHLIREVFENEFSKNGGEVKVTQASRDGGVDAVAFDPDPIRGGKIVIQAKRYTNTVGVAAVRDLYGTVVNEGALKGILITTSDYGPDAYEFARDKPLTLLNGSNLLHMLEQQGKKAKIDIKEAKLILAEKERSKD